MVNEDGGRQRGEHGHASTPQKKQCCDE